jgi:hypothetical protein
MKTSGSSIRPLSQGSLLVATATSGTLLGSLLLISVLLPASEPALVGANGLPDVADLRESQAVVLFTGDIEERHVLQRLSVEEYNENTRPGDPIELHITFRGGQATLLMRTEGGATVDSPVTGDNLRVVFSVGADTFYSEPGDCTVQLESITYLTIDTGGDAWHVAPRGVPIPEYTGTLSCNDVTDFRGDTRVSLNAVFLYHPPDSPLA